MKRGSIHIVLSLALLLNYTTSLAQPDFQTIVPSGPVIVGEAFQVQYVLEDTDKDSEFFAPDFKGFRIVSGPNIYTGSAYGTSGPRKLKNIVYTLAATGTGKLMIPGASVRIENRLYKSSGVWLQVISLSDAAGVKRKPQAEQVNEDVFLTPGEEPYTKIRRNLFMKVLVDKTSCFVGEPVTAVFKLYSRLDSKSDIVKNPGFYGFTVQDMINLDNRFSSTENVNGRDFDVHIVRKVQLYPLQAGHFVIDGMEVRNKVRFSKSAVSKQPEQEIIEGIVPDTDESTDPNTAVFENSMSTEPVAITVKPLPEKNRPDDFDGAAGNFRISSYLQKNRMAKNEEGELVIVISGKGNFTQLSPPVLKWPRGIDGFEPDIKDSLDHMQIPMRGKREFHYRFISSRAGDYALPSVNFSFFNPDTNSYMEIYAPPISFTVMNLENSIERVSGKEQVKRTYSNKSWNWFAGAAILVLASILFLYRIKIKKTTKIAEQLPGPVAPVTPSVAEILQPAIVFAGADDKTFYTILRDCIWKFFSQHLALSGSQVNKYSLSAGMQQKGIDENSRSFILELLMQCETGIFTNVEGIGNREKLLEQTRTLLEKIHKQVSA